MTPTPEQKAKLLELFRVVSDAVYDWATNNEDEDHPRLEGIVNQLEASFADRVCEIIDPENLIPCLLEMRSKILDALSQCRNDCERNKLNHFLGRDS